MWHELIFYWFIVLALEFSVFYGARAIEIFLNTEETIFEHFNNKISWRFHQWWLNFIGSAVGWVALGYLIFYRFGCSIDCEVVELQLVDIGIFIFAIIGITGYIPNTISRTDKLG